VCFGGNWFAKAHRAQADALEIEATAKRRLADEYDAAQERGEVRRAGNSSGLGELASVGEIGLTHKDINEARQIRPGRSRSSVFQQALTLECHRALKCAGLVI
jgi:hypothetical protein